MSDEEDDIDAEVGDEELYEILSAGANCERCQALDGHLLPYVATPLHFKCQCEVERVGFGKQRKQCDHAWQIRHEVNIRYGAHGFGLITRWTIIIECDDGSTFEADAAVDHGENPSLDFETVYNEAWNELTTTLRKL